MENHHFLMGKSTISIAIFNSFLYVYQRVLRIQKRFEQSIRNSQELTLGRCLECYNLQMFEARRWHASREIYMNIL